jgi:phage tail sheath protein FI
MAGFGNQSKFSTQAGTTALSGESFLQTVGSPQVESFSLVNGVASGALGAAEVATGFDLFEDVDTITVDFLIAPGMSSNADQATVVNDLVSIASSTRKDCVVNASPSRTAIVNSSTPTTDAVASADLFTRSSYLIVDNNYLKVYDKYNDKYIFIPAASSTAGLCAAADRDAAPWFSPAGQRRGAYLGITSTSYAPTKANRDVLYKAGLNPVGNIPGQGILLFGDKTFLARPSAFDRINVRRLFLAIERAIAIAARNVMFEFNDEFTRAEFVNLVEPFLREIQGRRGITDFRVVCDETNNTAAVIDRNEFITNIFIKPARSINFVTLNFVAVRTGVEFEEVVGTV